MSPGILHDGPLCKVLPILGEVLWLGETQSGTPSSTASSTAHCLALKFSNIFTMDNWSGRPDMASRFQRLEVGQRGC